MQTLAGRRTWVLGVVAALLAAACGSDNTSPESRPIIAKAATKSGDLQSGPVSEALANDLRVVVTRDGAPASDVTVTWSTGSGTVTPTSDQTDLDGVSTSTWMLGDTPGGVTATASVPNATGSPVTFTATATDAGGPGGTIVQVLTEGGTRFEPKDITVLVGTTVTWVWGTNAANHNVVPDNGVTPATSGALTSAPHDFQYTFNELGTFAYHCQAHGNVGGVGMSGTVTVVTTLP